MTEPTLGKKRTIRGTIGIFIRDYILPPLILSTIFSYNGSFEDFISLRTLFITVIWGFVKHFFIEHKLDNLIERIIEQVKKLEQNAVGEISKKFETTIEQITQKSTQQRIDKLKGGILKSFYKERWEKIRKDIETETSKCENIKEKDVLYLYEQIIFATKNCKKNIYSIDHNISSWKNINDVKGDRQDYDYKEQCISRRSDPTFKIYEAMKKKENSKIPIKRIFYICKNGNDLNNTEKAILKKLAQLSVSSNIENKLLFKNNIENDEEIKTKLKKLNDIIIFDEELAYKEHCVHDGILDEKGFDYSEIIQDTEIIKDYILKFNEIFNFAKDIKPFIQ